MHFKYDTVSLKMMTIVIRFQSVSQTKLLEYEAQVISFYDAFFFEFIKPTNLLMSTF